MGEKHFRSRQCLYFCVACLILTVMHGCVSLSDMRTRRAAHDHLNQGQLLFEQGDFKEAAKENQYVLSLSGKNDPADKAIFNLGLIYAHQDNPDRQYEKSVESFKRILEEYPDSPLYNHAKIWYHLLNEDIRLNAENVRLNARVETLSSINGYLVQHDQMFKTNDFKAALDANEKALALPDDKHRLDEILFNIGLIYAHHDNPDKNYKKSMEYFERLINDHPDSPLADQAKVWQSLLDVIEKSKQVDIEIEEKKKELAR